MAITKASPVKIRKATKIAVWREWTLSKCCMFFVQHGRDDYSKRKTNKQKTLDICPYKLMNVFMSVRLTYVAVDRVCKSHYGAADN